MNLRLNRSFAFLAIMIILFFASFFTANAQTCADPTNTIVAGRATKLQSSPNGGKVVVGVPDVAITVLATDISHYVTIITDPDGYFWTNQLNTCTDYNVFYQYSMSIDPIHYSSNPNEIRVNTGDNNPFPHWLQFRLTPQ